MSTVLLELIPGTLPTGVCFASEQERLNAYMAISNAVLNGATFFNYGDTQPSTDNQAYPWLRTTDMRWYRFSGSWITPYNYDLNERRWFAGSLTALQTYDGGDTNTPSDRSGPTWEEDEEFRGRVPIGPGEIPTSTPVTTLSVGDNSGAGSHAITQAELPAINLTLKAFVGDSTSGETYPAVPHDTDSTNTSYNILPNPLGSGNATSLVQPVRGLYCIKWTGRTYRTA